MRLYGKKFTRRFVDKKIKKTTETRDAILWAIDQTNRFCNVKIQGSDELITAHFPQNEAMKPEWLKIGNAVRVIHRGGIRGRVEIVGHGQAIPTPQVGSSSHPTIAGAGDMILSGLQITATDPPSISVNISSGTYRIDGITYSFTEGDFGLIMSATEPPMEMTDPYPPATMGEASIDYVMEDPALYTMSDLFVPFTMGETLGEFELDSAPVAGQFRYDGFEVGTDGIVHYLKGTAAFADPQFPTIDGNHIQITPWILVIGGATEITQGNIGQLWSVRVASAVELSAIAEFPWNGGYDYPETAITLSIKDQYGWAQSGSYNATLTMLIGSGQIWSEQSGYSENSVTQQFSGSAYNFMYQRNQIVAERSPMFLAEVTGDLNGVSNALRIILLDSLGAEIE